MRLIDADALMKEFADFVRSSNNSDFAPVPTWNDAVSLVESMPTIEDCKTGHWIYKKDTHREQGLNYQCDYCGSWNFYMTNYCPHCGLRLLEVEHEQKNDLSGRCD